MELLKLLERIHTFVIGRETEIKCLLTAINSGKHILLEGLPGTSKSTLLRTMTRVAGIPFYIIEGNVDLSPAKLVGHFNPSQVTSDGYKPEYFEKGPLSRAMEEGGILYIEEFNRMPPDVSNVLITPMEEGVLNVPRYGVIRAVRPFTVVSAQNPYDDVGTVRISRAFMDRVCLIKMDYQNEEEEREIVRLRTGFEEVNIVAAAVAITRRTRGHPDIKVGASVRAAIDLVDLFACLQKFFDHPAENFSIAARMALTNKIWLNEISNKSSDEIIDEIWRDLKSEFKIFEEKYGKQATHAVNKKSKEGSEKEGGSQDRKYEHLERKNQLFGKKMFDAAWHSHYYRIASYLNVNLDAIPIFFDTVNSLEFFVKVFGMLKPDARAIALKIANQIISRIARQITGIGHRFSDLRLIRSTDCSEIELDRTIENYIKEPETGILDNLVCYIRQRQQVAFLLMIDGSYSMRGIKVVLAAITAASIAYHFRRDYSVLSFNDTVTVLKSIDENVGPDVVLERLFALDLRSTTNIHGVLTNGLEQISRSKRKYGLILTDGAWNRGGDPLEVADKFDKLSVIGFPPSREDNIRLLANRGKGNFSFVKSVDEISAAIHMCLK